MSDATLEWKPVDAIIGGALCALFVLCTSLDHTAMGRAITTLLALLGGIIAWKSGSLSLPKSRLLWISLAALLVTTLVAVACSMAPKYSLKTFSRAHLWFWALFVLVASWATTTRRQVLLLQGLAAAGAFASIAGIILYFGAEKMEARGWIRSASDYVYTAFTESGDKYLRARGLIESYTRAAMILMLTMPATLALIMRAWHRRGFGELALWSVAFAISGYFLLLTKSRGAWLGTGLGCVLVFLFLRGKWWLLAAGMLLPVIALAFMPTERARALTLIKDLKNPDLLMSGRLDLWKQGDRPIAENPLVGVGYGGNIFLQKEVMKKYELRTDRRQPDLHSMYLQTRAEVGLLGSLAYLLFAAALLIFGWQLVRHVSYDEAPGSLVALALFIVILIAGRGYYFNEALIAHLYWPVLGMVAAGAWKDFKDRSLA